MIISRFVSVFFFKIRPTDNIIHVGYSLWLPAMVLNHCWWLEASIDVDQGRRPHCDVAGRGT